MLLMGIGAGIIGTGALAAYLRRKSQALAASKPATVERTVGVSQVASFFWGTEPFMLSKVHPALAPPLNKHPGLSRRGY
jgi:hypothetical protein